ncbi:MAG: DUF58 domain-containing protein [Bacteroidetes bacterium]|nr:DUF58 domain-containing protein [Bacteroidota bacterium]MBS1981408.1 DUF58 domain-containing protein [Bacteroidota bacterium]
MSGSNKSQAVGAGQEFSQYRSYQPGDDLRQLDWKMFARSERYYIKQADIETNVTVKFMLDASHSMAYKENELTKFQYGKVIIAALAYLARKQSDTFGLYAMNNKNLHIVHPRFEQQQFLRFLNGLVKLKSEGTWKNTDIEQLFDHHGKEIVVFVTDLYDENDDLFHFISRLKTPRNEVIVFHLMGRREAEFNFEGSFTFEDLETGIRTKANTQVQQKEYSTRVKNWLHQTRHRMLEKQINYHLVYLHEPVDQVLYDFLSARKRLMR